jgi:hypothetical protein
MGKKREDWDTLKAALKEAWQKIPNILIRKLVESMSQRLEAVGKSKAGKQNIKLWGTFLYNIA